MNGVSAPGAPSIDRLQVLAQSRSITAAKCICNLARTWPPSVSLNSHDYGLQVHISKLTRSWPPSVSLNSLNHGLQVHLWVHSIMASKCISKYSRLPPPSASPNSLDHCLGVYLWVHSIVIFKRTSNCSQAPPAASPDIACRWVAILIHRYIDT